MCEVMESGCKKKNAKPPKRIFIWVGEKRKGLSTFEEEKIESLFMAGGERPSLLVNTAHLIEGIWPSPGRNAIEKFTASQDEYKIVPKITKHIST